MCHADQPRWLTIYSFKNGRYVLANNDFPQEFRQWPHELREVLKYFPDAGEIAWHLGKAYETQRQFKLALRSYQKAADIYWQRSKKDKSFKTKWRTVRADIRVLRHQLKLS